MSDIDSRLLPGETVMLRGKVHWTVFWRVIIYLVLIALVYFRLDFGLLESYAEYSREPRLIKRLGLAPVLPILSWFNAYNIAMLVLLIGAMVGTLRALIYLLCTELALTNKRVIVKLGWIKHETFELDINRVTDLNVDQSMIGRQLNYGSITVLGMGRSLLTVNMIIDPLNFRHAVLSQVESTRILDQTIHNYSTTNGQR